MRKTLLHPALCFVLVLSYASALIAQKVPEPGSRTLMDAHNCYPYFEWWFDRIDRAISAGTPLAIEQDLSWYTDAKTGKSWSIVTHGEPLSPDSPTMEHYFFDRVRPIVEQALKDGNHGNWPLITLNLDFKENSPEHLAAVLALLHKYQPWLTTALKTGDPSIAQPLDIKPILVFTGEPDVQQKTFFDDLAEGDRVLLFGAIHTGDKNPHATPEEFAPAKATNYRRWWNNPWEVVEFDGQSKAGDWTLAKDARLRALVDHAHANGLWIRFYTLDGAQEKELSANGWFHDYNFGSIEAARKRWDAAIAAHVDYIASDQYELLGKEVKAKSAGRK
jgi:hypothetical protein